MKDIIKNSSFELTAIFIFFLVLASNLVIVNFTKGYFEYFNISFALVNFAPQMYDYERISAPVLVASISAAFIIFGILRASISIGDFLGAKTKPNKRVSKFIRRHKKFFKRLVRIMDFVVKISLIGTIMWMFYTFATDLSYNLGRSGAENINQFSSISSPGDDLQRVIIYKGDGEIITKTYDTSEEKFIDGYEVQKVDHYRVHYITR